MVENTGCAGNCLTKFKLDDNCSCFNILVVDDEELKKTESLILNKCRKHAKSNSPVSGSLSIVGEIQHFRSNRGSSSECTILKDKIDSHNSVWTLPRNWPLQKPTTSEDGCNTLPKNIYLKKSSIYDNRYGVWTRIGMAKGTRFGPYEGIFGYDQEEEHVMKDDYIDYFLNDTEYSCQFNWLNYINFASHQEQQNLIIIWNDGKIYYETTKNILPDTELLTWYEEKFLAEMEKSDCASKNISGSCEKIIISNIPRKYQIISKIPKPVIPREVKSYICDECGKSFPTNGLFTMHKEIHMQERRYVCDICGKKFSKVCYVKEHRRIHTGEKPYACNICGNRFSRNDNLNQHKKLHTDDKPYVCNICGRKFHRLSYLKSHEYTHKIEKPYVCGACGKGFTQLTSLNSHQRIHTGNKPYICESCGKEFRDISHLRKHQLIHTEDKPYVCNICNKKFALHRLLKLHMRIHTGEKPYSCDLCGKTFARSSALQTHKLVHTGLQPYGCSFCEQKFSQISSMKRHERTHTGEQPYTCDECGKKFSQTNSLKRHLLIHVREKYYP